MVAVRFVRRYFSRLSWTSSRLATRFSDFQSWADFILVESKFKGTDKEQRAAGESITSPYFFLKLGVKFEAASEHLYEVFLPG